MSDIKKKILNKIKNFGIKNFDYYYNAGVDAYNKKNHEKAIKSFKLAIEEKNKKPQVFYNLALCYQNLNQYDKAIVTYHKFLDLVPSDYDGLYNLALVYFTKENYPKAIEYFEKCIEIKKEEDAVDGLIIAYLNQNESQKAINFAEEILKSKNMDLYLKIAKVFENKNSLRTDFTFIDIAIEMYSKIIENDPKDYEAYISKSICYAKKGEWENSVKYCQEAIEKNPTSYEANNQMGLVYYCCNEIEKSVEYYEKALKLNPEGDYKIYSNLAYAYEKIKKYDKASKIFKKLLNTFPEFPAREEIQNHLRVIKKHF